MSTASHIRRLVADEWEGVHCRELPIDDPSLADIEAALRALDARVRTMLILHCDDGSQLVVGGGGGSYVVYIAEDEERFRNLVNSSAESRPPVVLRVGGQEGDYPARQVVGFGAAHEAVVAYAQAGAPAPSLVWEEQV